jgi:SSS family solute:Na+ symporter
MAVPTLIVHLIPAGILGFVICGFMASGISTLGANLSAVATLIANDIYGRFVNRKATPRQLILAVRLATVFAGALMIAITYLVPYLGGAVDAYLTVISIMDMPLFVIAIPYGLLWRKATWQGAITAYLAGSITGAILRFCFNVDVAPVTLISGGIAAVVCPIVSLMTREAGMQARLAGLFAGLRSKDEDAGPPSSPFGMKAGLAVFALGFAVFLGGVVMAGQSIAHGQAVALTGMVLYFLGGAWRAASV